MNAEELVGKFLDGTMSPAEEQSFRAMMERSPEFAEQVSQLSTLQTSLAGLRTPLTSDDHAFLAKTEEDVLHRMKKRGGVSGSNGSNGSLWKWAGSLGLLFLGGIGTLLIVTFNNVETSNTNLTNNTEQAGMTANRLGSEQQSGGGQLQANVAEPTDESVAGDVSDAMLAPEAQRITRTDGNGGSVETRIGEMQETKNNENTGSSVKGSSNNTPESTSVDQKEDEAAPPPNPAPPKDVLASGSAEDQQKIIAQLSLTRKSLRKAEDDGNVPQQAALYKQLGLLYSRLEGREKESRVSLNAALRLAQQAGLSELEAEVKKLMK